MNINGREIGPGQPPYVVAEVSCNHGGILERALQMIWWARQSGADACKFQCYTADTITLNSDRDDFIMKDGPWKGCRLWDLYNQAHTPFQWFPAIAAKAKELGITWFASVFDKSSVDLVDRLEAPCFKIASFEITDIPLIKYAASKGKPVIISTGMASEEELSDASQLMPTSQLAYLHCVSAYPARAEDYDLETLAACTNWQVPHGISDHTLGNDLAVAATALGACMIEKHFTLDRALGGPDAAFSADPAELKKMVKAVKATWAAMQPKPRPRPEGEEAQRQARRSLYCVRKIEAGEVVSEEHVRSIRPGYGLPPKEIEKVIGKVVKRTVERGEALNWEMFE